MAQPMPGPFLHAGVDRDAPGDDGREMLTARRPGEG
jgi:hypothetical protein